MRSVLPRPRKVRASRSQSSALRGLLSEQLHHIDRRPLSYAPVGSSARITCGWHQGRGNGNTLFLPAGHFVRLWFRTSLSARTISKYSKRHSIPFSTGLYPCNTGARQHFPSPCFGMKIRLKDWKMNDHSGYAVPPRGLSLRVRINCTFRFVSAPYRMYPVIPRYSAVWIFPIGRALIDTSLPSSNIRGLCLSKRALY